MPYDPVQTKPMRDEVTQLGVKELTTAEEVDNFINNSKGTSLIFINSVCGCAAGSARPGLALSLQGTTKPDNIATVFAGQDIEATERVRSKIEGYPPSSPCFVFFKDGKFSSIVQRHEIEQKQPEELADTLKKLYKQLCVQTGKE